MEGDTPNAGETGRMHEAWVRIAQAAHELIQPKVDASRTAHVVNLLETFESDLGPHLAPVIGPMLTDPATPELIKPLLALAVNEKHFGGSVVVGIAIGAILAPVLGAATAPTVQALSNATWHAAATTAGSPATIPLSPAEAAAAVVKGLGTVDSLAGEVAKSGVSKATFQTMADVYGRSFGFELALMLLRRQDIDRAEFDRIIHYSDVRNDFIPDILKAMYVPLSTGEVITANIKGHISDADAATRLGHAGIDPAQQPLLKLAAGRPLGLMEMFTVMHRGGASMADVQDTLRQSDVNDHWLPFLPFLQWHYPPLFQVVRAIGAGSMTPARAHTVLTYEGYEPQDVTAIVDSAQRTTAGTVHELTLAQITRMLETHLITEAQAITRIENHKFDAGTAQLVINLAAATREENLLNTAIRKVGTLYVAHKLDKTKATTELSTAGVPAASITLYFKYWDIERAANLHVPTVASIVGAYRRNIISATETKTRLTANGVVQADLAIVVADGFPPGDFSASKAQGTAALVAAVVNA